MEFIKDLSEEEIKEIDEDSSISYWRPIYQGDEITNYICYKCGKGDSFGKDPYGLDYCYRCGRKMINSYGVFGFIKLRCNLKIKFPTHREIRKVYIHDMPHD